MSARRSRTRREAEKEGYRSGLELAVARAAQEEGVEYEYEPEEWVIEWEPPIKSYLPDFVLTNGIIVEVKGRLTVQDRVKHLCIAEQYPHLDIRFVFQRDNTLTKRSKTRYSQWCEKHGFLYAFNSIPPEWAEEYT